MPLYQYVCEECHNEFETLVMSGEKPECPECESTKLEKRASMPGIPQIKGAMSNPCGDPSLPPCGAPGCRRTGR